MVPAAGGLAVGVLRWAVGGLDDAFDSAREKGFAARMAAEDARVAAAAADGGSGAAPGFVQKLTR